MADPRLQQIYRQRIGSFEEKIRIQTRRINWISLARFVSLAGALWMLVWGIRDHWFVWYLLAILLTATFLYLVSLHNRHKGRRDLHQQLRNLNETELSCLDFRYDALPDGTAHADPSHPWSHDLDLFGKGSLFQYLNRTSTLKGDALLAGWLTTEPEGPEAVEIRQGIIKDLTERLEFRQQFTARGSMVKEGSDDLRDLSGWLSTGTYIQKQRWLFPLAVGMSTVALAVVTAMILGHATIWHLLLVAVVNLTLLSPYLMRTNRYHSSVSKKHLLLEGYAELLRIIAGERFDHTGLSDRSRRSREGMREVARLSRLLNWFDQRLNMLLGVILNSLFLFDFWMLRLLENWKMKNRGEILEWIELIGWTDAMVSLGGFAYNHPGFTCPEFPSGEGDGTKAFVAHGLGHPLIPDQKRVDNDLTIDSERVVVITGANMAGKSTLLRSLGVNMVLAYTGCPVCATTFRTPFMGLASSMRTADSLKDEESYFLAEIRKLQVIVRRMEQGKPLLILLDEVLKGTNTTDKKKGSEGLIRRAVRYPVRCFIATHDLSLGKLEEQLPGKVVNYCFESYIREMELSFDYTIRKGIATNMNASFLMKKMGIMD